MGVAAVWLAVWLACDCGPLDVVSAGINERSAQHTSHLHPVPGSCCACVSPEACTSLHQPPHKAVTAASCVPDSLAEGECPTGMRLCCHLFTMSQRETDKTPPPATLQAMKTRDGEPFLLPRVTVNNLQESAQQLEPPTHSTAQSKGSSPETDWIPSLQSSQSSEMENKKANGKQSNTAELIPSAAHNPCITEEKESCRTHEVVIQGTAQQPELQGVDATQHRNLPVWDIDNSDHKLSVAFEKEGQEKRTAIESANSSAEKEKSEEHEPSVFLGVESDLHEAMGSIQGTHRTGISFPLKGDKENMTVEGNHYLDNYKRKAFQNGFGNLPETITQSNQYSPPETSKQFTEHKKENSYNAGESLHRNGYTAESDGRGDITHTSIKIPSDLNTFSDSKQNNKSLDAHGGGDDLMFSKSNACHPRQRRLAVLEDEPSTSMSDGWTEESNLKWIANKYHPVELYLDTLRQVSPLFSSISFSKGVAFSIFYWAYLAAFVYAACYILSPIVTPFSIVGVAVKVLLIHFFPSLIRLEVFRAVDYFLTFIYKTLT